MPSLSFGAEVPFVRHPGFELLLLMAANTSWATKPDRNTTMTFTEAGIFDAQSRLCALATTTFRHVRRGGATPDGAGRADAIATD